MSDENDFENADESSDAPGPKPPRVVLATRSKEGKPLGKVEVLASTKHGTTAMIGVKPPTLLEKGETLVMNAWILGSKHFTVVGEHKKPMKLPGTWYVVRDMISTKPGTKPGNAKPAPNSGYKPKAK